MLPRASLVDQFDEDPTSVADVIKSIAFVGSLYLLDPASQGYRAAVGTAIAEGLPRNGFSVQCLLLFAAALEWSGEQDYANTTLIEAKSMALGIGMQSRRFAREQGQQCTVLEESWRRTWWELYFFDAMFGGFDICPRMSSGMSSPMQICRAKRRFYSTGVSNQSPESPCEWTNECCVEYSSTANTGRV